jgi:hypothetical protein
VDAAANDEFRAAAADIDDQAVVARGGQIMGRTQEDQAAFFTTRDNFDRVAQCGFRSGKKRMGGSQPAHGIGRHGTNVQCRDACQALPEPREAAQGSGAVRGIQCAVRAQPHGHAYRIAQPIDDTRFAVFVARDHHVEAVGAEVNGGDEFAIVDLRFSRCGQEEMSAAAYR